MIYKTIDLCAGIGGIRKGFEMTGSFKNVLSAEIDTAAAATYKHLFKEDPTNDLTSDEFKKRLWKQSMMFYWQASRVSLSVESGIN